MSNHFIFKDGGGCHLKHRKFDSKEKKGIEYVLRKECRLFVMSRQGMVGFARCVVEKENKRRVGRD